MFARYDIAACQRFLWIALAIGTTQVVRADEPPPQRAAEEDRAEEQRRAAYLKSMQGLAARLKVARLASGTESECEMVEDSVLNWSDSARHPDFILPGTTWIWHDQGRPVLIGEIYGRTDSVGTWMLYVCNLSSDAVRCSDERLRADMTKSFYEPREIAAAPAVGKTKAERTVQIRQLASRFDAHQFWKDRFELRLLPNPIYRYGKETDRIIDGALLALVHGTNPEVLLLIEAHAADDGGARWKVAFGSLAGARCVVQLDGKDYWNCPPYMGDPADPRQGLRNLAAVVDRGGSGDADAAAPK